MEPETTNSNKTMKYHIRWYDVIRFSLGLYSKYVTINKTQQTLGGVVGPARKWRLECADVL
jgi:hypothetical protein